MVDGFRCIGAVQYVLDRDMLDAISLYDEVVERQSKDILARHNIKADQRNLARALRSMRVTATEKRADKLRKSLFGADNIPDEVLNEILKVLTPKLSEADEGLSQTRSQLSTISTIIRPLISGKWFERWADEQRIDFNPRIAKEMASRLLGQEIESHEDFRDWLAKVFEFFEEVVVTDQRPRPMGTVSRGSIRAYVNNWQRWTNKKSYEIYEQAVKQANMQNDYSFQQKVGRETFKSRSSFEFESEPANSRMNFAAITAAPPRRSQVVAEEARFFAYAEAPDLASPRAELFSVVISPADGKPVEATSSWSNKEQLESQLETWLRRRALAWGPAAVNVVFTSNDPADSFVLKLPNVSTAEASETILRSVQAF